MSAFREVVSVRMKRKHITLVGDDKYGHWWFEIGDPIEPESESYGWWPLTPVGLWETMGGVVGELNGQTYFGGRRSRDPRHGTEGDESFHPFVPVADPRTDDQIAECLRRFALAYHGEWRWVFGVGQNCQTFQEQAMRHCGLWKRPPGKASKGRW